MRRNGFQIGSPSLGKIRTFWNINLVVGIPFSRWGAQPFVTQPFLYPAGRTERITDRCDSVDRTSKCAKHPIQHALGWQAQMENDPALTRARVAAREHISRARVTQIMSLLTLPPYIQRFLGTLTDTKQIRFFSERRLRRLLCANSPSLRRDERNTTLRESRILNSI